MAIWTYKDLRFYESVLKELKKQPGSNPEYFEELIIEQKRKIRKHNKSNAEYDRTIVRDYGMDGYVEKFLLPEGIATMEEANEYFEDYERIYYMPSPWDCTGQAFTSWYKIFRKPDGRYLAYHSVGRDI